MSSHGNFCLTFSVGHYLLDRIERDSTYDCTPVIDAVNACYQTDISEQQLRQLLADPMMNYGPNRGYFMLYPLFDWLLSQQAIDRISLLEPRLDSDEVKHYAEHFGFDYYVAEPENTTQLLIESGVKTLGFKNNKGDFVHDEALIDQVMEDANTLLLVERNYGVVESGSGHFDRFVQDSRKRRIYQRQAFSSGFECFAPEVTERDNDHDQFVASQRAAMISNVTSFLIEKDIKPVKLVSSIEKLVLEYPPMAALCREYLDDVSDKNIDIEKLLADIEKHIPTDADIQIHRAAVLLVSVVTVVYGLYVAFDLLMNEGQNSLFKLDARRQEIKNIMKDIQHSLIDPTDAVSNRRKL